MTKISYFISNSLRKTPELSFIVRIELKRGKIKKVSILRQKKKSLVKILSKKVIDQRTTSTQTETLIHR